MRPEESRVRGLDMRASWDEFRGGWTQGMKFREVAPGSSHEAEDREENVRRADLEMARAVFLILIRRKP